MFHKFSTKPSKVKRNAKRSLHGQNSGEPYASNIDGSSGDRRDGHLRAASKRLRTSAAPDTLARAATDLEDGGHPEGSLPPGLSTAHVLGGDRHVFTLPDYADLTTTRHAIQATAGVEDELYLQMPYAALPSSDAIIAPGSPSQHQKIFFLNLFWTDLQPLIGIVGAADYETLLDPSFATTSGLADNKSALVDAVIALTLQYAYTSGLDKRVLADHIPSFIDVPEWPGFEYFHRCRARMRTNSDVDMDAIRCHMLLIIYLMKGGASREAYNLLGIAVRKAYVAKLHRAPPPQLSHEEKAMHMHIWWSLFALDSQCSLQLDMPAACQQSLLRCPVPTGDDIRRCLGQSATTSGLSDPSVYAFHALQLVVVVEEVVARAPTTDLFEQDAGDAAALEDHAQQLASALVRLSAWHDRLPPQLHAESGRTSSQTQDVRRRESIWQPQWLQRQRILLGLRCDHACVLLQRRIIGLQTQSLQPHGSITRSNATLGAHVQEQIDGALVHAIRIIEALSTVFSSSDLLYGWIEILQPLWDAVMTIAMYLRHPPPGAQISKAFECLTQAQALFTLFAPSSANAVAANESLRPLIQTLRDSCLAPDEITADNVAIDWETLVSSLDTQQMLDADFNGLLWPEAGLDYANVSAVPTA